MRRYIPVIAALALSALVAASWAEDYYTFVPGHARVPDIKGLYKDGIAIEASRLTFTQVSGAATGKGAWWRFTNLTANGAYDGFGRYTDAVTPVIVQVQRDNYSGADSLLTARHGSGLWSAAGSVTVLPFQGAASYETVVQGRDVHVVRGDSVSIPYSIGKDLTGWTVWFGAKANPADTAYAIPLREVTAYVTDPAAGSGLISLSAADTAVASKRYCGEVEIRKSGEVNTVLRFYLWIDADIIR